jgi:hypothetical protein
MMRGVQHAPPEHPHALAADVKERNLFEPPVRLASSKVAKSKPRELDMAPDGCVDRQVLRQYLIGWRLRRAKEFGEKAALGQEMMRENVTDGCSALVRPESEVAI